jgi:hypothetical protein
VSEFDEKLNALLSDPDRMAQIMQMAQALSGNVSPPPQQPATASAPPPLSTPDNGEDLLSSLTGSIDPGFLMRLLPLVRELSTDNSSNARTLLYALRPYLKQERQLRIERALQLAKLLHIGKKLFTDRGN